MLLAGAIVQPAWRPASSLINTDAAMCMADTRVNPVFIVYHSHTAKRRGPVGHRPRSG
jgi:hypothetical protein